MEDRLKKLYSWSVPIAVIMGILYLSISFMNGDGIGNPQKYAAQFKSLRPFFASISPSLENIGASVSPARTVLETSSTNAHVFTSTSTHPDVSTPKSSPVSPPVSQPPSVSGTGINGSNSSRTSSSPSGVASPPAGPPDLAVQIVDTGILSIDNIFTHATSVEPGKRGAVVFDVKNIGGSFSPQWIFSAKIPIPDSDYTSVTQSALAPGESIRFTMAFSNLNQNATNTVSFTVDPNIQVSNDPDRKNNNASTTLFRNY